MRFSPWLPALAWLGFLALLPACSRPERCPVVPGTRYEGELIRERTLAGLAVARARGRVGGRKPGLSEEAQRTARVAELLYKTRELSVDGKARSLRICKATFYKYLHHRGVALHAQPLPSPVANPAP